VNFFGGENNFCICHLGNTKERKKEVQQEFREAVVGDQVVKNLGKIAHVG